MTETIKKNRRGRVRLGAVGAAAGLMLVNVACADEGEPLRYQVASSQRLSAWLPAHAQPLKVPFTLHWQSSREQVAQRAVQAHLVQRLKSRFSALASLLAGMPVTGRVALPSGDARWLEANASFDPVLQSGDTVVLAPRAADVTLVLPSGYLCRVPHRSGVGILPYVDACQGGAPTHVWVVQPDGQIVQRGVAAWNQASSVEPAPGSWIWAPDASLDVSPTESGELAAFLGTQVGPPANYPWTQTRRLEVPADSQTASFPRPLFVSSSGWGAVGLLQTPTARMEPVGAATLMYNRTVPYAALKARLQPVEWLSFDFGYVSISDRLYGTSDLSGDQSYKDKSMDVKLRLLRESEWVPEFAVGARDLLGTGFFSSEYLVASKRFGDLDLSAGLAFGYMAGRQDVGNPFGLLSSRFKTRPRETSPTGGEFNAKAYFRGRAALFGGLQYQLPWDKWLLKLEYEGNDYTREPAGRPIKQDSAFNVGLVYRIAPWLDFSFGVERGNRAMFTLSAHTQLDRLATPKYLDPRGVPVSGDAPRQAAAMAQTVRDIEQQTELPVKRIDSDGLRMTVTLGGSDMGYERPVMDKVAAVVHRDAPASLKKIAVRMAQRGTLVAEVEIDRQSWVRQRTEFLAPSERVETMRTLPVTREGDGDGDRKAAYQSAPRRGVTYGFGMSYRQNLGGPDGFLLYQLATDLSAEWRLLNGTWLSGTTRLRLLDNYDNFKYTAPSQLPRVRTYIREYLVSSRLTIPNLQFNHLGRAGARGDHFYLVYAGLLESMFAGVGGEYLYRPVNSRLAFGVDVNHVRQRDFGQKLSMRDYSVNTGHVTAYLDTGISDVLLKLSAGQYLAGDKGVTVDASRMFRNGVSIGAYVTKTNVSAAQFGEGAFDKGVYVNIPFDAMLPRSGSGQAAILYAPLIRDGGAKLNRRFTLFEMTRARDPRALHHGAGEGR